MGFWFTTYNTVAVSALTMAGMLKLSQLFLSAFFAILLGVSETYVLF